MVPATLSSGNCNAFPNPESEPPISDTASVIVGLASCKVSRYFFSSSPTGDKLLARVNSGEMILNLTQQKRLFEMLNASSGIRGVSVQPPQAAEITLSPNMMKALLPSPSSGETVRFEIKGRTLVGILEKEKNINYRS